MKALATGDDAGLDAALDDADAAFSDDCKTAARALPNRYNPGNIAVTGGSSRDDGPATRRQQRGRQAAGTPATGAGVYAANAALERGGTAYDSRPWR